jgi:nitrile hydratase subunit alpha
MSTHEHGHGDDHAELDETELRVRALQSVLTRKGYIDPAALDVIVETYQTRIGPRNGARVVAKAWTDPVFMRWLLQDASAAIASLGYTGRQGEHMVALPNTDQVHNMVVCTLCSCYIARAPCAIRAGCWRSSASRCRTIAKSACGTRRLKCATW